MMYPSSSVTRRPLPARTSHAAAPAGAEQGYSLAQGLAMFQLFKDAVTLVQLNVLLIFAIIIPIAVPGLLLCVWRWHFAVKPTSRRAAWWHWSLTLLHELACTWLFWQLSHEPAEPDFPNWHFLTAGYMIGAITSGLALVEAWVRGRSYDSTPAANAGLPETDGI